MWKFQSMNPSPLLAAARRIVVSWSYTTQVRGEMPPGLASSRMANPLEAKFEPSLPTS